jgi:hypothetical protein
MPTIVGLAIGLLFSFLANHIYCVRFLPSLPLVLVILNYPAQLLFDAWHNAGYGPYGDASWVIYFRMIVVQWLLIGVLVGVGWRRSHGKHNA